MKTELHIVLAGVLFGTAANSHAQPAITQQPTNQSVSLGANVTFQLAATTAHPPILYQWRFASTNLPLATSARLTLTNVHTANAGDYDVLVTDRSGSIPSHVAHLNVDPTFTKITTGAIVTEMGTGTACAWGDYDNDGFIDLIVTSANAGTPQRNILFHNNRDGTFTKITNTVVTSEARDWRSCSWADYDNDGNLDLFVTSTDANGLAAQNELFRNNGNGTFTKTTAETAGAIVPGGGGSESAVWADYDNDGFVDVFIARYGIDWLYHNDGGGVFSSVTNSVAGPVQDVSYGAAWGDYNNDGLPDLFVAVINEPSTNRLYLNLGGGSFARVTSGSIFTDHAHAWNCSWGDYDNDGYLDLFVGGDHNFLYHNNGDGTFTSMTNSAVSCILNVGGGMWGDYDNDGFLDMAGPGTLIHNNGDGSFTQILTGSIVNDGGINPISCAWGDYDNDGFLDLFVARGSDAAVESNLLYRNNGNSNGWIKIKLVGTLSNRSAVGAKVRVQATIGGRTFWQMREINTGIGFSAGPLEAHFGVGDATNLEQVRIEWPSGIVQTLINVPPRQFLTVLEHQENPSGPINFTGTERSTVLL